VPGFPPSGAIRWLDSSVDLIARATRRPEHDDYVLTRRPPTSKLEEQRMMMFRIRELEQRKSPQLPGGGELRISSVFHALPGAPNSAAPNIEVP